MAVKTRVLSTADIRRSDIVDSALRLFARSGLSGTTIGAIAEDAGISPAYVFKLFPGKTALFVAALENCYAQIFKVLSEASKASGSSLPTDVLDRMGAAYANLIADRDLLMLQVQAQAAIAVPEIKDTVRSGIARITALAMDCSRATPTEVQRFVAYGQLCHLVTTLDIFDNDDEPWATTLTQGIRHVRSSQPRQAAG